MTEVQARLEVFWRALRELQTAGWEISSARDATHLSERVSDDEIRNQMLSLAAIYPENFLCPGCGTEWIVTHFTNPATQMGWCPRCGTMGNDR